MVYTTVLRVVWGTIPTWIYIMYKKGTRSTLTKRYIVDKCLECYTYTQDTPMKDLAYRIAGSILNNAWWDQGKLKMKTPSVKQMNIILQHIDQAKNKVNGGLT